MSIFNSLKPYLPIAGEAVSWPPQHARLFIGGPLPGMNELIDEAKKGKGKGNGYARLKKAWTDSIAIVAKTSRLPRFERARLSFRWFERGRRRDPDNVAAGGRKLILDGLVVAKVLPGDGWAHVAGWTDSFEVGPRAGVEVTIEAA